MKIGGECGSVVRAGRREQGRRNREPRRNHERGMMNQERGTEQQRRVKCWMSGERESAKKRIGQTNPPRRKPKAANKLGRVLPHVADGLVRVCSEARRPRGNAEWRKLSVVSCQLSVECLAATRRGARSNCGMRISDCGLGEVVSGQSSVVSRVFSGDPQGSAFQLRNADFGLRNGGSCQWSVVSRVFSGDPQGSAFQLRNADFGLRIQQSEPGVRRGGTGHDSRITNHGPRVASHQHSALSTQSQGFAVGSTLERCSSPAPASNLEMK